MSKDAEEKTLKKFLGRFLRLFLSVLIIPIKGISGGSQRLELTDLFQPSSPDSEERDVEFIENISSEKAKTMLSDITCSCLREVDIREEK